MKRLWTTWRGVWVWLVLAGVAELTLGWTTSQAQSTGSSSVSAVCQQAEVVLLVDQSGSMGGKDAGSIVHPRANDPLKLRFHGLLFAARKLGSEFLQLKDIPGRPRMTFSLAIVNFGDDAEVLYWSAEQAWVTLAQADEKSWKNLWRSLEQRLKEEEQRLAKANLGQTNFVAAFQKAVELFAQRGTVQGGCPRRAVIVLTDGEPSRPEGGFTVSEHMRRVEELVRRHFPREESYQIYITGINDPAQPASWERMLPHWRKLVQDDSNLSVRRVQLAVSPDQVSDRLIRIFEELGKGKADEPPVDVTKPYTVPPYLQEISFIFSKRDLNEHLEVTDETGPLNSSRKDVKVEILGRDEPTETLRVHLPLPGKWTVKTTSGRADVLIYPNKIRAAAKLIAPADGKALQWVQTNVEFQFVDSEGNPLPDYGPRYAVTPAASINAAGQEWKVSLRPNTQKQQAFWGDFVPMEQGNHVLTVSGHTQDSDGKRIEVVNGAVSDFLVDLVTPEQISGPNTISGGCNSLQQAVPVPLVYGFRGPDGAVVKIDAPAQWTLAVTSSTKTWPLSMSGPDNEGKYITTFTPEINGSHQLQASVTIIDPAKGTSYPRSFATTPFNVERTQFVEIRLLQPKLGGSVVGETLGFGWLPPFLWSKPTPLDVEVQLVTKDDNGREVPAAFSGEGLLAVKMDHAVAGQVMPLPAPRSTGKDGQFRVRVEGLELGQYAVSIQTPANLPCGFAWAATKPQGALELTAHPLLRLLQGIFLAVMLGALGFVGYRWRKRQHPCQGWLIIQDARGRRVAGGYWRLGVYNSYVFKDLPPEVGVKRMSVSCKNAEWSKEPRIQVQIVPHGGAPWTPFEMTPGRRVIPNNYALVYGNPDQPIP